MIVISFVFSEKKAAIEKERSDLVAENENAKRLQQQLSEELKEIHRSLSEAKADIEVLSPGLLSFF